MKLRNKKTGEIIEYFNNTNGIFPDSLAELCKEWEDYEEPKEFWYISCEGKINRVPYSEYCYYQEKEIGNYFETKEEAEKAVEKLKAWKRLKDVGIKFKGWQDIANPEVIWVGIRADHLTEQDQSDLDLLFSGGEECKGE